MSIKPDELGAAVAEALRIYQEATDEGIVDAISKTAIEAAAVVAAKARSLYGDNYADDITARNPAKRRRNYKDKILAYVTAGDHYRVAHLLEHGHAMIRGGRVIAPDVKGHPHFADGERYAEDHLVENIRKEIEG